MICCSGIFLVWIFAIFSVITIALTGGICFYKYYTNQDIYVTVIHIKSLRKYLSLNMIDLYTAGLLWIFAFILLIVIICAYKKIKFIGTLIKVKFTVFSIILTFFYKCYILLGKINLL